MTIKSFTKLTLSALLLAAATPSAIAEGEGGAVTLSNGTTVSWPDFVKALNDPSSIPATLPDTDPAVTALNQAKTDSVTAKTNYDDAVKALEDARTAAETAKTAAENAATKVAETRDAYNTANNLVASWNEQINSKQSEYNVVKEDLEEAEKDTERQTPQWLTDALQAARNFQTAYNGNDSNVKIWYKTISDRGGDGLYLSFTEPSSSDLSEIEGNWVPSNASLFYDNIANDASVTVDYVMIFLGSDYTTTTNHCLSVTIPNKKRIAYASEEALNTLVNSGQYGEYVNKDLREQLTTQKNNLLSEIRTLNNNKAAYTTPDAENNPEGYVPAEGAGNMTKLDRMKYDYDAAQADQTTADRNVTTSNTAVETAERNVTTANTALRDAQTDLNAARAAYNTALQNAKDNATANYKTVTLNEDVTVDTTIANFDGTFDGKNHVITLKDGVDNLFGTLSGTVANVAVNGEIANIPSGARLSRVASWTGSGTYYDANNTPTSNISTIGELGFIARDRFGADVAAGQLAYLTADTKVYNITVYKSATNATPAYVNLKDGKFDNGTELGITANTFVKSAIIDDNIADMDNVFYTDTNGDNLCKNVVITDKIDFYCPVDIAATNVTFDRAFKSGMNTVILPFDLSADNHSSIDALCKYDVETADKFWFKKIEGTIPANTPFLLYAKEGASEFELNPLQNITIKQTEKQIVTDEGSANDPSMCYGTFKKASVEEFIGNYESYKIYGLNSNGNFQAASSTASFPAFRMVISSELVRNNDTQRAPRLIGILDENGIDITEEIITGVKNVTEETSSLNIAGGQGEIVITSDADYGKVEVYTMAGGVAAVADVMAGTTSVSLQKGIYIVMGKKVMVK